jgi:hypothetical protein
MDQPTSEWVTVKEWSGGPGSTKTERLTASAKRLRISFRTTGGERYGLLDIVVSGEDEEVLGGIFSHQADEQGVTSGSFLIDQNTTSFYLQITSYGLHWRVSVEQRT